MSVSSHLTPEPERRLWTILEGKDTTGQYAYLSDTERGHIRRILAETLPGAPAEWKKALAAK